MRLSLAWSAILLALSVGLAAGWTAAEAEKNASIVAKFGGRYLARAGRTVTLE